MIHLDMLARAKGSPIDQIQNGAKIIREKGITRKDHPSLSVSFTGTAYDSVYAVCMLFISNGQQVYELQPTLGCMLGETTVDFVSEDLLRYPFDCFYLDLKDSQCRVWDGERKSVPARGVYVTPDLGGVNRLTLVFWGHEDGDPLDDAIQWLTVDLNQAIRRSCGRIDLDATFKKIYLNPQLDTSIENTKSQPREYSKILGTEGPGGYDSMNVLLRLTINAILYINYKDADVSKPIKKSIKAPRRFRRNAPAVNSTTIRTLGRKYENKKHKGLFIGHGRRRMVPGHWKEVWVGTKTDPQGNSQLGTHREPRWIQPYIVNAYSKMEVIRSTVRVK